MTRLLDVVERMPPGGTLILVEPRLEIPNYSVIQMRGFVLAPDEELRRISKRTDITVRTQAAGGAAPLPRARQIVVTMDREGEVVGMR